VLVGFIIGLEVLTAQIVRLHSLQSAWPVPTASTARAVLLAATSMLIDVSTVRALRLDAKLAIKMNACVAKTDGTFRIKSATNVRRLKGASLDGVLTIKAANSAPPDITCLAKRAENAHHH
jgi:hypothetical protein